jgi:GTPase
VFAINKADRPGADRLRQELEVALGFKTGHVYRHVPAHHGMRSGASSRTASSKADKERAGDGAVWEPPVVATMAVRDEGVRELSAALDRHLDFLAKSGALAARRARQREQRTREVVERALRRWVFSPAGPRAALEEALADVAAGRRSPYEAASGLVDRIRGGDGI